MSAFRQNPQIITLCTARSGAPEVREMIAETMRARSEAFRVSGVGLEDGGASAWGWCETDLPRS